MAYGISVFFAFLSMFFLFLIPFYSASFLCFLTSQNECFSVQSFAQKTFPFKSTIWVPSRDSPSSKWTVLSGQLFIQFRFTPWLNKVRGSFFLCWISPICLLLKIFYVRKSGTLRWHMEKPPAFFCVFCISIHSSFLFLIPFYSASFLCFLSGIQKLAKMNSFKLQSFARKAFLFKFQIWVPSRDSPSSKWTV